jgi:hypothetical protein
VDIYLIRPDGTGLKRISGHGNFCSGPKWTPDSKNVIAYCMSAEETDTYRSGDKDGASGNRTDERISIRYGTKGAQWHNIVFERC